MSSFPLFDCFFFFSGLSLHCIPTLSASTSYLIRTPSPSSKAYAYSSPLPVTMPAFPMAASSPTAAITVTTSTRPSTSTAMVKRPAPLWFGGAASCVAALVSHPFDLAKVRLQTVQGHARNGMLKTMTLIIRNEGFFALYNGLSASLLRQGTYSTFRFGAYDGLKQVVTKGRRKYPGSLLWKGLG